MSNSTELTPFGEFNTGILVACVILGLSFLVGAPGNLLVIWTILRHIKQRSHTVVLILHLAAADLLALITLPVWIYSLVQHWMYGQTICKALVYVVNVCMFSSIFFITLMGVGRYLAIHHPFLMMRWETGSLTNRCLVVLWFLALLLGVPTLLTFSTDETEELEHQCFIREFDSVSKIVIVLCLETLVGFVIPFTILIVCYCLVAAHLRKSSYRSKQKSMVLVHSVMIAFTVCWLPYHIVNVIDLVCLLGLGLDEECVPQSAVFSTGALAFISSSVNPVLYALLSRNFAGGLREFPLVRLFKEIANLKPEELAVQQQSGQRAADHQEELISASV